jgi:hypothetical protein
MRIAAISGGNFCKPMLDEMGLFLYNVGSYGNF